MMLDNTPTLTDTVFSNSVRKPAMAERRTTTTAQPYPSFEQVETVRRDARRAQAEVLWSLVRSLFARQTRKA